MFPLFALGLYRLVNGGRAGLYAVGLFLLATSLYSAFMAVVVGWLFAWAYTLPLKGTEERRMILARVFWYTAAVTLVTSYYWLPMMEMSRDSMRSLFMTAPLFSELLWPFDPPKFLERLYSCLPGMARLPWQSCSWCGDEGSPRLRTGACACLPFFWRLPFFRRSWSLSTAPPICGATWIFPSGSALFPDWRWRRSAPGFWQEIGCPCRRAGDSDGRFVWDCPPRRLPFPRLFCTWRRWMLPSACFCCCFSCAPG